MTPSNLTLPRAAAVYKRLDPEPRADRAGPRGRLAVRVMGSEDWRRSGLAPTTHSRPRPGGSRRCRADPFRSPAKGAGLGGSGFPRTDAVPSPCSSAESALQDTEDSFFRTMHIESAREQCPAARSLSAFRGQPRDVVRAASFKGSDPVPARRRGASDTRGRTFRFRLRVPAAGERKKFPLRSHCERKNFVIKNVSIFRSRVDAVGQSPERREDCATGH